MIESEPSLTGEEADNDKGEIQSAKEIVQYLSKTAKTLKIYLPNNPIQQKFITGLFEKLEVHLSEYGPLRLRIKQFELFCLSQAIYENMNRLESIAFKLYADGLREISFYPGLEKEEVITLLKILGHEANNDESGGARADDDMVTLLWEKHLTHIQYIVVDDLRGEIDVFEPCKEMRTQPSLPQQLNAVYQQEVQAASVPFSPLGVEVPALHIFKLTEEEISSMKRELRWEEEIDIVNELEGMLFDILRIETDPARFSEVIQIIDTILEELIFKADFLHARKVLEFFWEMLESERPLPPELVVLLKNALIQAGNSERIASLGPVLDRLSSEDLDHFLPFMVLFKKEVIPSVIALLALVKTLKTRRILCDILVELGKMDVKLIISRMEDGNWFVLRNLIYVLGKIGDEQILDVLPRFIHHEEVKVRKEVLHVLDTMANPKTEKLLIGFVADADLSNRVYAIKSLVKKQVEAGLPLLLELIGRKSFEMKALYEKKEIFNAIAMLGGDAVVPEIEKHIHVRWSFFKNNQADERGLCAALSLQRIGTPAAIGALQRGRRSGKKSVREACQKSLEALGAIKP